MIKRISATHAARNFSDLVNRVYYQGASFEIERGNEVIARIIPAAPASTISLASLDQAWKHLPRLNPEDTVLFATSLHDIRQSTTLPDSQWNCARFNSA